MGTGAAPPPLEDLTTTAFKDDAWLAHNPLSKYNVLEYFSRSPFYVPPRSVQDEYLVAEERVRDSEPRDEPQPAHARLPAVNVE